MTTILTRRFWRDAGVRAAKTIAQAAAALLGTGAVGILDVDWVGVLSASTLAGVLSLLMSIVASDDPE